MLAAAVVDYDDGLKRTEVLMSKAITDKKKQWGLVASTIRVGPQILFQHPDVTESLQDTET